MGRVDKLLTRGVNKVLPSKEGLEKLLSGKKIKLYQGFDPTGRLHLGHAAGLKKLMDFSDLGHEVIFLFGTGTVLVGDPSQRDTKRKIISSREIRNNISSWRKQASPLVNFKVVKVKENGDWLTKLKLRDLIKIGSQISAVQLFKRDSFQRRIDKGDTVWYHETMYPLLQGYDSVVLNVDLEIGGNDQEFNMLIGRELQKKMNKREKYVMTLKMILGTDGKPMSKSSGNCIWIDEPANEMYGKLMSIPDNQIDIYIEVLTELPLKLQKDVGPLQAKKKLAYAVVKQIHGDAKSIKARDQFEITFKKRSFPMDADVVVISKNETLLGVISLASGASTSQAKRWIAQGAVDINNETITDPTYVVKAETELKIGKRQFYKVRYK